MDYSKVRIALIALVAGLVIGAGAFALFIMNDDIFGGRSGGSAVAPSAMNARIVTEQGDAITISEIADGRPAVVTFWATWCPFCIDELPDLEELRAQYGDRIAFIYIDAADGDRETVEGAAAWLAENGYAELPAYYDTEEAAAKAFALGYLPTPILISSDGRVADMIEESIDPEELREALDALV